MKSHIIAALGTVVCMTLAFLLLWFLTIGAPVPEEEEGIMISFGDSDTGGGQEDGLLAANSVPETVAPPLTSSMPSDNDLMTQEDEQTLALQRQREEERRKQQQAEAERLRKQKEEQARIEAERIAKEKALAEKKAKEQAAIDKASAFGSLFGHTSSEEGANGIAGETASSGTKGNPLGKGSSGGNSWSLNGRSLVGSLPHPQGEFHQDGIVVVNIIVDASGKVISASVGSGTNISDDATRQMAVKAAKLAVFNGVDTPDRAFGTITYKFVYN